MANGTENALNIVNIAINTNCTCRCRWCSIWRLREKEMPWNTVLSTADMCKKLGVASVIITGGEPSLHSNFINIIKLFRENFKHVLLCTDGSSILSIINTAHEFIDSFLISLDGHNRETHKCSRGIDNYEDIIRMIYTTKELNPLARIQVSHLIQKSNAYHLKNFYLRVRQLPIDVLSIVVPNAYSAAFGHNVFPIGDFEKEIYRINVDELKKQLHKILTMDQQSDSPVLVQTIKTFDMYIDYIKSWQLNRRPIVKRFCNTPISSITVLQDGTLKPCFYLSKNFSSVFSSKWQSDRKKFLKHFVGNSEQFRNECNICSLFSC